MLPRIIDLYRKNGLSEISRGINDFLIHTVVKNLDFLVGGETIWEREWDVLCILDGCRFDTFDQVYNDDCNSIKSVGSTSPEWVQNTFAGHDTSNVAYVSANPHSAELSADEFAELHLEGTRETEYNIETVPPKALTDVAVRLWRTRDDFDKLIIHYMQPHVPFRSRPEWFSDQKGSDGWGADIWGQIRYSIDKDELFAAYRDNLEWVLGDGGVATLATAIDGKIAITADHGNAAGEWGFYGHPWGAPIKEVRRVPWAVIEGSDAGEYSPESDNQQEFDVDRQLDALGYT